MQIKHCPFCGSNQVKIGESYQHTFDGPIIHQHRVYCCTCGASGGYQRSESAAVDVWNKRAEFSLFE